MKIPLFPLLYFTQGLLCLGFGAFVLSKNRRSLLNIIYFLFCLGIAGWMIPLSFVSSKLFPLSISMLLCKFIFSCVVFLPTLALHFVIEYLDDNVPGNVKSGLKIAYLLTFFFLILVWCSKNFITGLREYSWGTYPKGGYVHVMHSIFVVATAIYVLHLLWEGLRLIKSKHGKNNSYYETKYFFIAFLFATLACSDFIHSWGIGFFPLGAIFMTFFVIFITYAIFKYGVLGISIVVKKSLIYSILISITASVYFICVYLISVLVGDLTKANSIPVIAIVLATVTLLSKPLEQKIQLTIDKLFFRKSREVIERENVLLLQEVQKHDRLKAVATLAAGMAHEIKNPLTAIRTFAEYLPQKYDEPEFRDKFKRIVVDEVDRVNNIVQQLLEFAKPQEPVLKTESIISILDETLSLLSSNLVAGKIDVQKKYESQPLVSADKNQLKQAFLNLFLNNIQAMPGGGVLTVKTFTSSSGRAVIIISDTGMGIPKENLTHIFDPFFTTKESGTGLGLSIVHGIIHKHNGEIKIESEVGKGTSTTVTLKLKTSP